MFQGIIYIPFFYFQQTRLKSVKDFVFHSVYEWFPALAILLVNKSIVEAITGFVIYYLAFISLYEIGYLLNDQLAFREPAGRKRAARLNAKAIFFFILIRVSVFLAITIYTRNTDNYFWHAWFVLLLVVFVIHNSLKSAALKILSFSYLAFARFLSPFIFLVGYSLLSILLVPVMINYVLFRLITYMDSKHLVVSMDRRSPGFRAGYYVLIAPFSIVAAFIHHSFLPLIFNLYYLSATLVFILVSEKFR